MEIPTRDETARLADQLERSFRGGAWQGPALAELLDGLDAAAANRRPLAGGHTIHEIAGHVAFWLATTSRRIEAGAGSAEESAADWPQVDASEATWRTTLATLEAAHRRLHSLVAGLDDARLDDPVAGSDPTVRGLLLGILQHNAYHAGQMALLRPAAAEPPP